MEYYSSEGLTHASQHGNWIILLSSLVMQSEIKNGSGNKLGLARCVEMGRTTECGEGVTARL